jgi:hypothetical protein
MTLPLPPSQRICGAALGWRSDFPYPNSLLDTIKAYNILSKNLHTYQDFRVIRHDDRYFIFIIENLNLSHNSFGIAMPSEPVSRKARYGFEILDAVILTGTTGSESM